MYTCVFVCDCILGLPLGAYYVLRALTHWDAFSPSNARFIAALLDAFDKVLKRNAQNQDLLLYWLGVSVALRHLLRGERGAPNDDAVEQTLEHESSRSASPSSTPLSTRRADSPQATFVGALATVTSAFFERCVAMVVTQLDPLLVSAVLEGDMNHPERNAAPNARVQCQMFFFVSFVQNVNNLSHFRLSLSWVLSCFVLFCFFFVSKI